MRITQQQRDVKRKLAVLQQARESANVAKTARHLGISRQCFYKWRRASEQHSEAGLINMKPCPENMTLRTPAEVEEKIVHLRRTYRFGPVPRARPLWLEEAKQCRGWTQKRLDITPGITRLLQVLGRSDIPFDEMVKLDYTYVTGWSLSWDIKLAAPDPAGGGSEAPGAPRPSPRATSRF